MVCRTQLFTICPQGYQTKDCLLTSLLPATLRPPIFNVVGSRSKGPFVIAAVDPDTPTPQEPTRAQVRHFLGGNFYMGSHTRPTLLSNSTPAISHYREPRPQAGSDPHRYGLRLLITPFLMRVSEPNLCR
jgi:hypothetical protein